MATGEELRLLCSSCVTPQGLTSYPLGSLMRSSERLFHLEDRLLAACEHDGALGPLKSLQELWEIRYELAWQGSVPLEVEDLWASLRVRAERCAEQVEEELGAEKTREAITSAVLEHSGGRAGGRMLVVLGEYVLPGGVNLLDAAVHAWGETWEDEKERDLQVMVLPEAVGRHVVAAAGLRRDRRWVSSAHLQEHDTPAVLETAMGLFESHGDGPMRVLEDALQAARAV